jgi:CheY-like chemotaxis protein
MPRISCAAPGVCTASVQLPPPRARSGGYTPAGGDFHAGFNAVLIRLCHLEAVPVRVLLVDDSPVFLDAAQKLLEREGLTVVGTASSSAAAIEATDELHPDVVLVDIFLGDESGIDLARELVERNTSGAPVVVILISTEQEIEFAERIATSRASGFVSKSELSAAAITRMLPVKLA